MAPQLSEQTPLDDFLTMNQSNGTTTERLSNPFQEASLLSKAFFLWPNSLIRLGMEKSIEERDLPQIMTGEFSKVNLQMLEKIWTSELERVHRLKEKLPEGSPQREQLRPSLIRALSMDFLVSTWYVQPLMMASACARVVMAVAIGELIQSFEDGTTKSYLWASILIGCNLIVLFEHHHVFFITWRKGMQFRIGSVAAVFSKALRLNSVGGDVSPGQVMNLVSNDVERFLITTLFISYLFWAPAQALLILFVGIYLIGYSFAAGFLLLLIFFVPLQFYLSKKFGILRSRVAQITDKRMTLVSQAILGARVMKMSGWEKQLEDRIAKVRAEEIKQIRKASVFKALNEAIFFVTTVVVSLTVFICHVYTGGELTPSNVFSITTLASVLQLELTKHFSLAVMSGSECRVSVKRIQKFLETPELDVGTIYSKNEEKGKKEKGSVAMSFSNVSCYWGSLSRTERNIRPPPALENITAHFKYGQLTCIIGKVGSGKSALLLALAGELSPHEGNITRNFSSLAYASQDTWIMNGTVKENIVMGEPFEVQHYEEVLEACQLCHDLQQFSNGDETIVGDRGIQCSGGQRARIGLARALYRNADVMLLDDPLSAVDSKTGHLLFRDAIHKMAQKRGKCVILVTHQHQHIRDTECILMENGTISKIGSFNECSTMTGDHSYLNGKGKEFASFVGAVDGDKFPSQERVISDVQSAHKDGQKSQEEAKATGVVSKETFLHYARAMGGLHSALVLLALFFVTQGAYLFSIVMMGKWSERPKDQQTDDDILAIVLGLGVTVIVLSILRSVVAFSLTIRASKQLHDSMVQAVLRSKIEFFDTNPSGRILNRFSADVGSNDDLLPSTMFDFLMCAFIVLGALATTVVALPFILIVVPPLGCYFYRVRRAFVTTSRELKRHEGLARSPIYAMMSESISGTATIRANDATEFIRRKFENYHDAHSRAFFAFLASSRWVGFRMDSMMFILTTFSCLAAALFVQQGWFQVDPVIFGLALSMLIQLGSIFQWTVRQSAEVVNQMVCVERVSEYSNLLPEAPLCSDVDDSPKALNWPQSGSIEVKNLSVRYRSSLPLCLKRASFRIEGGQRVGVVGRTGSGKSTLVQSLFRILEPEDGQIIIDGIDSASLGLHKLRKGMSVINQVPVLFSGCTLRENLDPFLNYSDDEIWEALEDVQMMNAVKELSTPVAEGGSNFSVGERQLLCLARAILEKSKVLVLDEPTANVDKRTDELLQVSLNKSFKGSTIISVAHRLETIIDNDMILVLGNGEVIEYGSPSDLIEKEGHFARMIEDTGRAMSGELKMRAAAKAKRA